VTTNQHVAPKPQANADSQLAIRTVDGGNKDANQPTNKPDSKEKRRVVTGFIEGGCPILNLPSGRLRVGTKMQSANR